MTLGRGFATVAISASILTGARAEETGMLSGLNSTGHEIGGTLGIAVFTSIAAAVSGGITASSFVLVLSKGPGFV